MTFQYSIHLIFAYACYNMICPQVVNKCLEMGAQKASFMPADMANPADSDRVVQYAIDQLGGLDFLVLNHIGPSPYAMWDGDVEHARWLLQVYNHSLDKMLPNVI